MVQCFKFQARMIEREEGTFICKRFTYYNTILYGGMQKMRGKFKRFISILLVALLIIPTSWIPKVAEAATNSDIPVLLYHRVVDNPSNQWTDTSIETFK